MRESQPGVIQPAAPPPLGPWETAVAEMVDVRPALREQDGEWIVPDNWPVASRDRKAHVLWTWTDGRTTSSEMWLGPEEGEVRWGEATGSHLDTAAFDRGVELAREALNMGADRSAVLPGSRDRQRMQQIDGLLKQADQQALEPLVDAVYDLAITPEDLAAVQSHFRRRVDGLQQSGQESLAAVLEGLSQGRLPGLDKLLAQTLLRSEKPHQRARIVAAQRLLWAPPKQHLNELFDATRKLAQELGEDRRRLKVLPTLLLLAQPQHVDWLCVQMEEAPRDIVWALAEGVEERYRSPMPTLPTECQEQLAKAMLARFWKERERSLGRSAQPSVLAALTHAVGLLVAESTVEEVAKVLAIGFLEPRELELGTIPRTTFLLAERLQERGLLAVKRAFGDQDLALCRLWYLSGRFK